MNDEVLSCNVEVDSIVDEVCRYFDYQFDGRSTFSRPKLLLPDSPFRIGLIVGPSGTGKSTLLRQFGAEEVIAWDESKAIVSHFSDAEDARKRLGAVGLNTIPSWVKPYQVLSTGEKFRADLARRLKSGAVVDEFTSVVDRNVAKSCSSAIRRYVDHEGLSGIVLASCHYDIIDWLNPDWVFDTFSGTMSGRGSERRPAIDLSIDPCGHEEWAAFHPHHYLTSKINKAASCWVVSWEGRKVAFVSALAFPNGNFKDAWREHRTVVLPDFQGLGIGIAASDAVAQHFVDRGCRYFSKTAHPRFGEYRNKSPLWKPTSKNGKARPDYGKTRSKTKEDGHKMGHAGRACYSHEYVGRD